MSGWVSAPQAHSMVSNINFDIWIFFCGGRSLWISYEKYIKDGKVFAHLGFKSKVVSGPLTDVRAWVGFCTSSPQQGVKYQLCYLNFFCGRRVSINIPWTIYQERQSSCPLRFSVKGTALAFNRMKCLGDFLHLKPTVKYQLL